MKLLELYKEALDIEHQSSREDYENNQKLPIIERVQKGLTMVNLSVVMEFYDGEPDEYCATLQSPLKYIRRAHISCLSNLSKVREGSMVRLSNAGCAFEMQVVEDSVMHFVLDPNAFERKNCYIDAIDYPRVQWQMDVIETDSTYKMLNATVDFLLNNEERRNKIEQLIDGEYKEIYDKIVEFSESSLNESQNLAIVNALKSDYIHLIQGPPGTGKTHTIAYLCAELIRQGNKVFVSGPTHTAINNCLDKIASVVRDNTKVVKVGERYQSSDLHNKDWVGEIPRLPKGRYSNDVRFSQSGIVIGATPYAVCYPATKRLDGWEFDYAIVDESAQMSIPMAIAVMAHCDKVIFVGDHQQLNPIITSNTNNPLLQCSIFEFLANLYPQELTLLNQTYRLNSELLNVPNNTFYEGKLHSDVRVEKPYLDFKIYTRHGNVLTHESSGLLFEHEEFDGMGHSPYEASVISDMVFDLISNGVELNQIAVITPYRAQVREIRQTILERGVLNEKKIHEFFIDTVDRMQGQERDYVFYSLANPNPLEVKERLEFFYSANRLNVAITRAKIKCVVMANYRVFDICKNFESSTDNISKELNKGILAFAKYYELSDKIRYNPFDDDDVWN